MLKVNKLLESNRKLQDEIAELSKKQDRLLRENKQLQKKLDDFLNIFKLPEVSNKKFIPKDEELANEEEENYEPLNVFLG